MSVRFIKQEPYVDEHGIYESIDAYAQEGYASAYRCVMTKEMFVEVYNKWIKPTYNTFVPSHHSDDDADDWCD